jgi:hypothetical protein
MRMSAFGRIAATRLRKKKGKTEVSPLYTLYALNVFWPVRGTSCLLLADHLAAVMLSTRV